MMTVPPMAIVTSEQMSLATARPDHAREARARRALRRQGYVLRKDRARTWNIDHHGGYMIIEGAGR